MAEWKSFVVSNLSSVKDAINTLNQTSAQIVLCIDKDMKFVGLVVDGDIRRGLINGVGLDDPIMMVANQKPYVVGPNKSRSEAIQLMETLRISHIPIVDDAGELCGLHAIGDPLVPELRENIFVIMAGGFGRRMGSRVTHAPKPMLLISGKPILEHLIIRARDSGFTQFVIAVHYLGEVVEQHFGNGSSLGVKISYLKEEFPRGTAGALTLLSPTPTLPVVVSNADLVSNVDFGSLLDFHESHSGDMTMAVREHEWQNPFGVVELSDGEVVGIKEKPLNVSTISVGMYVLDPTVLREIDFEEKYDMPQLIERLIKKGKHIIPFPIFESWADIANYEDLILFNSSHLSEQENY